MSSKQLSGNRCQRNIARKYSARTNVTKLFSNKITLSANKLARLSPIKHFRTCLSFGVRYKSKTIMLYPIRALVRLALA